MSFPTTQAYTRGKRVVDCDAPCLTGLCMRLVCAHGLYIGVSAGGTLALGEQVVLLSRPYSDSCSETLLCSGTHIRYDLATIIDLIPTAVTASAEMQTQGARESCVIILSIERIGEKFFASVSTPIRFS